MRILSNAKINLNLMIKGTTNNGYHDLYSVVAPISLCDEINIKINNTGSVKIVCNDETIPTDDKNIITKSIEKMRTIFKFDYGFEIELNKTIPTEAGLGGGSSNGAAVLLALNEMLNLNLTTQQLVEIGVEIGADVPFFIYNKIAVMEGVGNFITPFEAECFKPFVLLVKPKKGVLTRKAFELYDKTPKTKEIIKPILHELISENKIEDISYYLKNDLERAAIQLNLDIEKILEFFRKDNIPCSMSGSGSCCFALFFNESDIKKYYNKFEKEGFFVKITKII